MKVEGGCLCGACRYASDAEPLFQGNCHCRDCQKATGGAYAPALVMPRASVRITGPVRYFDRTGDSGQRVRRGFCAECGSGLFGLPDMVPHVMSIFAGTLDEPSSYRPAMDIYTASAQPWDHMDAALPKFPKTPAL